MKTRQWRAFPFLPASQTLVDENHADGTKAVGESDGQCLPSYRRVENWFGGISL